MNTKLKYLFGVFLFLFLCSSTIEYDQEKRDKKLNKFVKNNFENIKVLKEEIIIPDTFISFYENKAYILKTEKDSTLGYLLFNKALGCRVGGCSADGSKSKDNQDPYYFATLYNTDNTIIEVNILEYYSEYGFEITSRRWLKQFAHKMGCNLKVNQEIDGISGATISVNSIIHEVNGNCDLVKYLSNN
jgi:hypothetical protein